MEQIVIDPQFLTLVPVLIGLLAALKHSGFPNRYIPLMALLAGLIISLFITGGDIYKALVMGAGLAFSAVGTHSSFKNTLKK